MATQGPTPVDTGAAALVVTRPIDRAPAPLVPGPGTTGRIPTVATPQGPPESAPPSVAPGPGTGQTSRTTAAVTPAVIELPVETPTPADQGNNVIPTVPNLIEVLADGTIIIQNATALNFTGSGVAVTANGSTATLTISSGGTLDKIVNGTSYANIPTANGNVIISAGGSIWNFGTNATLSAPGNITTTANISGSYILGNGSQLTGLAATYGNANVVANLAALGSNPISTTGNITGGNVLGGANVNATTHTGTTVSVSANVTGGNLLTAGLISATGNITGNYFIGNGSQLTGISAGTNTGNVTFNNQIVLGTGTNDGGGGLYLAPGNASIANSAVQYFRVRGGDVPTHIHLDTGNNDYYDQYFGDDAQYVKLANIGNVVIGAANVSSSAQWSFDPNGTLIVPAANGVPGQISTATTQASEKGFDLRITAGNTGGCSVSGGDVYLSAGVGYNGISHNGGNVNIVTGDRYGNIVGNIWNFGSTGALTLPLGGVKIKDTVGNSVAFGLNAGFSLQGIEAVAIGSYAGNNRQGNNSVAIGNTAGAGGSVSTNYVSGAESPSTTLVVVSTTGIGPGMIISGTGFFGNITVVTVTNSTTLEISASAGFTPSGTLTFTGNQGANAVAIGQGAGSTNQGTGAVAIGARAGYTNQGNNSIILNATGTNLDQITANTFTVSPVRNDVANTANVMFYNATSKEITYGNVISVAGNITSGNLDAVNLVINSISSDDSTFVTIEDGVNVNGTISATGNVTANNVSLIGNGFLSFTSGSTLTFGDTPVTNRYYVDATRIDTYTQNGSQARPFKTIAAAQAAIATAIAGGLNPEVEPIYIILLSNITENVTLATNHVYLVGQNGQIHQPIILTGNIIVQPTSGTLNNNHFSLTGIEVVGGTNGKAIYVTGTFPTRLSLQDVWITASGNSGAGLYQDNTGTGTYTHGGPIKVSHNGTGDVYCFDIRKGTASFDTVETSGATQVGAAGPGATLTFNNSQLDANGDVVVETYGNGVLVVTNSVIKNSAANSYGIKLNAVANVAGTVSVGQSAFNVPLGTGQAVWLDPNTTPGLSGVFAWSGASFYPGTNTTINPSIIPAPLAILAGTIANPILYGDITSYSVAQDWDLIDNNASALSFDTTGKAGVLELVTTNSAEGVKMSGFASVVGNITGGNLNAAGLSLSGNVVSALNASSSIAAGTTISAVGNITGGNVLGGANVNATTHTGTTVSVTANITGGNVLTGGLISATGNVTGGNLITAGLATVTGNITSGNLNAAGLSLSSNVVSALNVTANIAGGNITTPGLISATGNVSGGNLNVTGNIVDTGALSIITGSNGNIALAPNGTGNVSVSSNISITGNTATITSANLQIGYLEIPQISLSANVTANLTVSGKHYYTTSASNLALTLADNSAVSWPVGTAISVINRGTANVTVAPAAGVSLYLAGNSTSANRVVTTYGMATVMNVAANVWMINGTVV